MIIEKEKRSNIVSVTDEMQNYVVQQKHEQHKLQSGLLNPRAMLYWLYAHACVCVDVVWHFEDVSCTISILLVG